MSTCRYHTSRDRFVEVAVQGFVHELYLIGASLKDLGAKCFAFTKLDESAIRGIKESAFTVDEKIGKE